jgi:hypothetical protein
MNYYLFAVLTLLAVVGVMVFFLIIPVKRPGGVLASISTLS